MDEQTSPPPGAIPLGLLFPLVFTCSGLFFILVALGIIPTDPDSLHAPEWVLGASGGMFLFVGLFMFVRFIPWPGGEQSIIRHILETALLFLTMSSFSAVFLWVGFGPGERQFQSSVSLGPLSIFGMDSKEATGRIMFGGFGVFATLITVYYLVTHIWKLIDLINHRLER